MTKTNRISRFDLIYQFMKIYLFFCYLFIGVKAQKSSLLNDVTDSARKTYEFTESDLNKEKYSKCNGDFKGRVWVIFDHEIKFYCPIDVLYSSRRLRISIFVETHLNAIKNCIKLGLNSGNFEIFKQNSYSSINGRVKSDFEIIQNDAIIAHIL